MRSIGFPKCYGRNFTLRFVGEYTSVETSIKLAISIAAVKSTVFRARKVQGHMGKVIPDRAEILSTHGFHNQAIPMVGSIHSSTQSARTEHFRTAVINDGTRN
jgi:hypothetical protein